MLVQRVILEPIHEAHETAEYVVQTAAKMALFCPLEKFPRFCLFL